LREQEFGFFIGLVLRQHQVATGHRRARVRFERGTNPLGHVKTVLSRPISIPGMSGCSNGVADGVGDHPVIFEERARQGHAKIKKTGGLAAKEFGIQLGGGEDRREGKIKEKTEAAGGKNVVITSVGR